jgi:hypothetical protein
MGHDNSFHDKPNCSDSHRPQDIRVGGKHDKDRLHGVQGRNIEGDECSHDKEHSYHTFRKRMDPYTDG